MPAAAKALVRFRKLHSFVAARHNIALWIREVHSYMFGEVAPKFFVGCDEVFGSVGALW